MDISQTTAPKSDQQNFDDYLSGPKTVTISEVREGSSEQPAEVHLVEFPGRPYKPSKSMRRVLQFAWGKDTDPYAGRRLTLYGDPEVKFGGSKVGGIKISHMSHIDRELSMSLTETKGKRKPYTVKPLVEAPAPQQRQTTADPLVAALEASAVPKEKWLEYSSRVVGRDLTSAHDLTPDEKQKVIDALNQDAAESGEQA